MTRITLGQNLPSLRAQRSLEQNSERLGSISERLSSGQRINHASDDAASLAVADTLNTDSRVYLAAVKNTNDAISALSIAEGALEQLTGIVTHQKELAVQAANGTYSLVQRKALQQEADALTEEYNRIISSTEFNSISLLNNPDKDIRIQLGYGVDGSIQFDLASEMGQTIGTGTFQDVVSTASIGSDPYSLASCDYDGDGNTDIIAAMWGSDYLRLLNGQGDGTFVSGGTLTSGNNPSAVIMVDLNNDGWDDIINTAYLDREVGVRLSDGAGGFENRTDFDVDGYAWDIDVGDFNGDGNHDLIVANRVTGTGLSLLVGNGDGTFQASSAFGGSSPANECEVEVGDFNNDGKDDFVSGADVYLGNGNGTFAILEDAFDYSYSESIKVADFNRDGYLDLAGGRGTQVGVFLGSGDGTFDVAVTYSTSDSFRTVEVADLNGDGFDDLINSGRYNYVRLGNGDGTFYSQSANSEGQLARDIEFADFNGDGVLDMASTQYLSNDAVNVMLSNTENVTSQSHLYLLSSDGAAHAMVALDQNLENLSQQLGALGGVRSRLEVASRNLHTASDNYISAASRITDADIAQESAEMVRTQILIQAASAVVAQANQQPALAVKLLTGKS